MHRLGELCVCERVVPDVLMCGLDLSEYMLHISKYLNPQKNAWKTNDHMRSHNRIYMPLYMIIKSKKQIDS